MLHVIVKVKVEWPFLIKHLYILIVTYIVSSHVSDFFFRWFIVNADDSMTIDLRHFL